MILRSFAVDLLYLVVSPFVILVYFVVSRGFTRPKYRRGMVQKLGYVPIREASGGEERPSIWIHAVSVGEVQTVVPLVELLAGRHPDHDISISVSTYTGYGVARKRFPDRTVFYAPLDVSFCVTRAFHRRRPTALLLVELELWPNFLLVARRLGVPALVVNGRLTERSCRGYERVGPLGRWLFSLVDDFAVQNDEYAERFARLGVPFERVEVVGNLKHGRSAGVTTEEAFSLRERIGWGHAKRLTVLVVGCTHPREEQMLCAALTRLRETEPGLRLVLAPRHIERLRSGEEDGWGADRPIVRWSRWKELDADPLGDEILLVDTVGDLESFYAVADLVVVGGSFVPHGGHNVFEPARLGKPVCFGPHTSNFREEVRILLAAGAGVEAADENELLDCLAHWITDRSEREAVGQKASETLDALQGAVSRHADRVAETLQLFIHGAS